jgi:hypothetical protein
MALIIGKDSMNVATGFSPRRIFFSPAEKF